jgi:hypothetical protein
MTSSMLPYHFPHNTGPKPVLEVAEVAAEAEQGDMEERMTMTTMTTTTTTAEITIREASCGEKQMQQSVMEKYT